METFANVLNIIVILGGLIFVIAQWKNGKGVKNAGDISIANSTIDLIQKQANAIGVELEKAQKQIKLDHDDIIRLQEANKHKDQLLKEYMTIITNRNPELEVVLKDVRNFLDALNRKINDGVKVQINASH